MEKQIRGVSITVLLIAMLTHLAFPLDVHGQLGESIKFSHITVEDGLSHHEVLFIVQDSQGFLWFGTKHGLNKYDGMSVTPFLHDSENLNSLSGNFAHWIQEDQTGALWIATWGDGISRYDPKSDKFTNYRHEESNPQSLASDSVWSLYVDRKGRVWAATDGGLSIFDPETETFVSYRHNPQNRNSLSHNTVSRIREDDQGIFWISTYGGGLNRFDPETETFTSYKHRQDDPKSLSNNKLWSVYIDSRSRIWIGSEKGLNRFDPETETFTSYRHDETDPNSLSFDTVTFIYEDHAGMLWLGTFGGGLNRFDPERESFVHYQHDAQDSHSLANNIIMSIYEDTTGTLWVATYGGVDKYDPEENHFKHYHDDPNSLSDAKVRSIYQDRNGSVWIGTSGGGLNRLDKARSSFVQYLHDDDDPTSISENDVWAISQDKRGDLWVGTHGAGMNRFNPAKQTFVRYQHAPDNPNTLASDAVYDLVVDEKRDVLWIAAYLSGLDKFDIVKETFTHYRYDAHNPGGIVSNWSTTVFVDSKGFVWVGTEAGLSRFTVETELFTNFKHTKSDPKSLSDNKIQAIYEDSRNIVWIGTGDGLNRYDEGTHSFKRYYERDGLAGNLIGGITEDNEGRLWISTDKGLSRFNPQNEIFRNYDQRDGLQGDFFFMHSAHRNEAGELFFGGISGFNVFRPDELKDNQHIPRVVFTNFQLFNQPVRVGEDSPLTQHINQAQQITLKHDQDVFSIEFVALNYRNSRKNQYAYMMEGFDKGFTYTDSDDRSVTYTNLDPGRYSFRVKASNNDGVWNEKGRSIEILILPPWWETLWFRGIVVVLAVGLIFGFLRLRIRAIQQSNRQLERQVVRRTRELKAEKERAEILREESETANRAKSIFLANMSHELRTPLTAMLGFTQILERDLTIGKEQRGEISIINRSGQHLLSLINDILDIAKIEAGRATLHETNFDLYTFLSGISELFHGRIIEKGLFFTMEKDTDVPRYIKGDEGKLRQVLINLLGNALKFTKTGGVTLRVRSGDGAENIQTLHFEVEDTGIGIDSDQLENIFDPFIQTSDSADKTVGTGLGLAISRQFVNLMGGSIEVESKIKSGSLFRFGVAAGSIESSEIEDTLRSRRVIGLAPGQPSFRILVVEDILESRKLLVKLLETVGFEVQEASDGKQGVEVFNSWHPDLIWMDLRMPGMDGYEATKQIKKTEAGQKTIVIALTAHAFKEEQQEIFNVGCVDFITKPYVVEELFAAMGKHLGIQFIYEDQDVSLLDLPKNSADILTPEALAELPKEIKNDLLKVIAKLDQKGCFTILEQLSVTNKEVAYVLRMLVNNYQFEELENILRRIE